MERIQLNLQNIYSFVDTKEIDALKSSALEFNKDLNNPEGKYKGYTGCVITSYSIHYTKLYERK